jgi:hypothetical protein
MLGGRDLRNRPLYVRRNVIEGLKLKQQKYREKERGFYKP